MTVVEDPQRVAKKAKPKSQASTGQATAKGTRPSFWEVYGYDSDTQERIERQIANQFRKLDTDRL